MGGLDHRTIVRHIAIGVNDKFSFGTFSMRAHLVLFETNVPILSTDFRERRLRITVTNKP